MGKHRDAPAPTCLWQIKELYSLIQSSNLMNKQIAAKSGYSPHILTAIFANRSRPLLPTIEALFNTVGYTLTPIPKERLDDVREYLSRSTTGT